jgi:hypothetical protein
MLNWQLRRAQWDSPQNHALTELVPVVDGDVAPIKSNKPPNVGGLRNFGCSSLRG